MKQTTRFLPIMEALLFRSERASLLIAGAARFIALRARDARIRLAMLRSESVVEATGGFVGAVRPGQRQASAELDLLLAERDGAA